MPLDRAHPDDVAFDRISRMKSTLHVPRIRWRRAPNSAVRLTVLVTGAACESDARHTVASLRDEWTRAHRRDEDLVVIAVLDTAAAIESALGASPGYARDIVAVVRHDVVFLEGSLKPLLERLQGDPDCGAVAPRVFVDSSTQLQPAIRAWPSALTRLWHAAANRWAIAARWYVPRRARESMQWWTTEQALASEALPSACVFQRRKAIERASGLRDPRFDGELCDLDFARRVARSGYKLVFEPRSRVVVRETGGDGANTFESTRARGRQRGALRSRAAFEERHFGPFERALQRVAAALEVRGCPRSAAHATDLGLVHDSPVFEFGRPVRYVLELSRSPRFLDAAGAVGEDHVFRFEDAAWNWIGSGPHFVRALERDSGRVIGVWRFRKPRVSAAETALSARDAERAAA